MGQAQPPGQFRLGKTQGFEALNLVANRQMLASQIALDQPVAGDKAQAAVAFHRVDAMGKQNGLQGSA